MNKLTKKIVSVAIVLTLASFVAVPVVQAATVAELEALIASLTAQLAGLATQLAELQGTPAAGIPDACTGITFTTNLKQGSIGADVKCLQALLNTSADTQVAASGAGSLGNETTTFGSLTKAAVIKFQEKYASDCLASYGLTTGTGFVGTTTRAKLNAILTAGGEVVPEGCECTVWTAGACGAGTCTATTERQYTRTCTPAACLAETKCETDATCAAAPTTEYLSVALSADTPAATGIATNAQFVPFMKFDMSAGLEDVKISTITFTRSGAGSTSDFDKIWLKVGNEIVSNHKSISTDGTSVLNLSDYEIPAGETKTFTLVASMTGVSGRVNVLSIASADAISCDEDTINGTFPIASNAMNTLTYSVSGVTFDDKGSDSTVDIGTEDVVLGEFSLNVAAGTAKKDGVFTSIRLKQVGTGGKVAYLANLVLYQASTKVSTETLTSGEYVTFGVDNYELERGKSRTFTIKGDALSDTGAEDGDVITFKLDKAYDLVVLEEGSTTGCEVTGAGTSLKDYTVNAGKFSVSKDTSSPADKNYGVETDGITGLIAKVDVGQTVKVDGLKVYLQEDSVINNGTDDGADAAEVNNDIDNVSLYVNDTLIDSLDAVTETTADNDRTIEASNFYYDFDTEFELEDNDLIKLTFDITTDADTDNIYKFEFDKDDFTSPEYVSTGDSVATGDKSGSVIGNKITITASEVTLTRNDGYVAGETFVAGTTGAKLMQFVVNAGNASDVTVKKLVFDITGADDVGYYTNLTLKVGSEIVDSGDIVQGANKTVGALTLDSIDYKIAKTAQAVFALYADINSSAVVSSALKFTVSANSIINDEQGEEITLSGDNLISSATLTIAAGGTLSVALDGDTPTNAILVADAADNVLARYKFSAKNGAVNITDLYLANYAGSTTTTQLDALISSLKIVVGSEVISSKVLTSGTAHYDLGSTNAITVPKDSSVVVIVKADLNPINLASKTNKRVQIRLYGVKVSETNATVPTTLKAATDVAGADAVSANELVVTKTVPTLTAASVASTVLGNSFKELYAFNVTANSKGSLGIKRIIFSMGGTLNGTAITNVAANIVDDSAKVYVAGTEITTATITEGTDKVTVVFANTAIPSIAAGQTKKISLKATLTGFVPDRGDVLESSVEEVSDYAAAAAYSGVDAGATFVWCDNSETPDNTVGTAYWMNDNYLDDLDLAPATLTY